MAEFTIGEFEYQSRKLNAVQQWHVTRRLAPLLRSFDDVLAAAATKLIKAGEAGADPESGFSLKDIQAMSPLLDAVSKMSDEDTEFVLGACLGACSRRKEGSGARFVPIWSPSAAEPLYDDIDMFVMLRIFASVLEADLKGFSSARR